MATSTGLDPAFAAFEWLDFDTVLLRSQEDTSRDAELLHVDEAIAWLVFSGEGDLMGAPAPQAAVVADDQQLASTTPLI
jgi:hypothetical protein